jgi:magnesium chelatase subunit D
MNPEEGELRPQLLDRFGLTVEVAATRDPEERADVVRRRLAYEADPEGFAAQWTAADAELAEHIAAARERLPQVVLGDHALREITTVCAAFDVDGLRADLVTAKASVALAAWAGRGEVTTDDVRTAARLALPHRRRRNPFDAPGLDEQQLDDALSSVEPETDPDDDPGSGLASFPPGEDAGADARTQEGSDDVASSEVVPSSGAEKKTQAPGESFTPVALDVPGVNRRQGAAGRRSRTEGGDGRLTGARTPDGRARSLHLTATLRAAAPHQLQRGRNGDLVLHAGDLREAVREGREGNLVLFVVDASGSMAARQRMTAVKGAVLSLLTDAYQRRDKVGLVSFRRDAAEVLLPPTSSVDAAVRRLTELPTGGRTPLTAGLLTAADLLRVERVRDPSRRALVVVVTDGRHTSGPSPQLAAAHVKRLAAATVVVDCESGRVRLGLAQELGVQLDARTFRLEELSADSLTRVVKAA